MLVKPMTHTLRELLTKSSIRTVDEIQGNILKRGKRNVISRRFHAKDDEKAIAIWRSDLGRILHIFNVRSFTFVLPSLIFRSQTELGINTHATVSGVHQDPANTHTTASDVRLGVSNPHPIISEVQNQPVSTIRTLTVIE